MSRLIEAAIGTGGDFSTLAAWITEMKADYLDLVDKDVILKAVLIENKVYSETLVLPVADNWVTDRNHYFWLTARPDVKHTGKAGTGARIIPPGSGSENSIVSFYGLWATIEDLEISSSVDNSILSYLLVIGAGTVQKNIIHGLHTNVMYSLYGINHDLGNLSARSDNFIKIADNIIYDIKYTGTENQGSIYGIYAHCNAPGDKVYILNNTIHDISHARSPYEVVGIYSGQASHIAIKNDYVYNNVVTQIRRLGGSGTQRCFGPVSANLYAGNNVSSDNTAPGTDSLTGATYSELFKDADVERDFTPLRSSILRRAGQTQLSFNPTDVIDIPRNSGVCNIGAFEDASKRKKIIYFLRKSLDVIRRVHGYNYNLGLNSTQLLIPEKNIPVDKYPALTYAINDSMYTPITQEEYTSGSDIVGTDGWSISIIGFLHRKAMDLQLTGDVVAAAEDLIEDILRAIANDIYIRLEGFVYNVYIKNIDHLYDVFEDPIYAVRVDIAIKYDFNKDLP